VKEKSKSEEAETSNELKEDEWDTCAQERYVFILQPMHHLGWNRDYNIIKCPSKLNGISLKWVHGHDMCEYGLDELSYRCSLDINNPNL
jgi:hypothetical protein